jgi:hypothetical protein
MAESGIAWEHQYGLQECLGGLHVASGLIYILLMHPKE